jgi:hypothetical protein
MRNLIKNDKLIKNDNSIINKFKNKKIYHLHNSYHLGDNIYNFIMFYIIKNFIEENNIVIFYYALKEHLPQLKEFLCSSNIFLASLEYKPQSSIELWGDNPLFKLINDDESKPYSMNEYLKIFYNNVLRILCINFNITRYCYVDNELITRYDNIDDKYKNFDILILNSQPRSNQYNYNKFEWDNYILHLNKTFKILTTTKVDNLLCTFDDNLTVKDIAALSTKAKVIIAINSGVVPALLNIQTLMNVNCFYIFDKWKFFTYPNFKYTKLITDISVDELKSYITC